MDRFQLALDSLDPETSLIELAYMLVQACEEVVEQGGEPEVDAAVALISNRVGFASPTDCMSAESWHKLVQLCENRITAQVSLIEEKAH